MNDRLVLGKRTLRGVALGPRLRLGERSSLLVVGPTQVGKTSSLVVPAILSWSDALVVTSVKSDVVEVTRRWRGALGAVQVLEPGRDGGLTWDPLERVESLRHALRAAHELTSRASPHADSEFWNALATKLVAALFVIARQSRRSVFDVARVLDTRAFDEWLTRASEAADLLRGFLEHDAKTVDGVITTAETMLLAWRFAQPLARVRDVVHGPHTLYLVSPRGEQRHYESLFRGALRAVLEEQQRLVDAGSARPLLLVLDEAATVAPLDDLDELAATLAGLSVTLVTVVQDFAQLNARWGKRAATIVNNHTTRLVLGGLADPAVATFLPEAAGSSEAPLRRLSPGTGLVVSRSAPVAPVRLVPWWRQRHLRHRGRRDVATIRWWNRRT
ncbi:MAG TPA: type IV secretory system conjugative DNA transfer family protein [Acidimicrobiales bacterium]|nr:type IV secretory system conjugative DNA transfer family protein [Acidimicrobiales bacterium]